MEIFARAICITTSSVVDGVGTVLSVMPPNSLLPDVANDCCVRLQQFDRNAKVGPAGEFIVHLSCSATVDADSQEVVAAKKVELQEFLKAAVRLLFDTAACTAMVDDAGEVAPAPAVGIPNPPSPDDSRSKPKPKLIWALFFNKTAHAEKPSKLPANIFVTEETHWGDLDFDGATAQAKRIFEQIFPGEPFLPPLPDPDAVQDDAAVLLDTEGQGADFEDREVSVTFEELRLGLMLTADQDGLIRVSGMKEGGAAESSGEIRVGDLLTTVAGQSTSGMGVDDVVGLVGSAPRPLTLVLSTSVQPHVPAPD